MINGKFSRSCAEAEPRKTMLLRVASRSTSWWGTVGRDPMYLKTKLTKRRRILRTMLGGRTTLLATCGVESGRYWEALVFTCSGLETEQIPTQLGDLSDSRLDWSAADGECITSLRHARFA